VSKEGVKANIAEVASKQERSCPIQPKGRLP
jgi:hypothetical protein